MSDACEDVFGGASMTDGSLRDVRETDELDSDLAILSSSRRRHSLYYLRENEIASVDELADHLADEDGDAAVSADDRFETPELALVHSDLPALRDAGVIEYDPRNGTVRYRRPPESVRALLELCSRLEREPKRSEE